MLSSILRVYPRLAPRPTCKPHSVRRGNPAWVIIYLGRRSPCASCSLPGTSAFRGKARRRAASRPLPHAEAGGLCPCLALLPAGVAWPPALLPAPVVSYTTFSPLPLPAAPSGRGLGGWGGMSLWPDPAGCPVPGITRRRALWSADFPRPWKSRAAITRSAWGFHHTMSLMVCQLI